MIEKTYELAAMDEKSVKRVIQDESLHHLHRVFSKGKGLPEHFSNSNVHMAVTMYANIPINN